MYKLLITELAQNDLDEIAGYIVNQLANPIAVGTFLDEVEKCYENLRSNPYIYAKSNDARLEKEGYRRALIKNYLLMFKVNEETKTVTAYRFFYGAMDYFKLL